MAKPGDFVKFKWNGDKIIGEMRRAEVRGLGLTRSQAVKHAKKNHPGWKNITGRAEKSVKAQGRIHRDGNAFVAEWGSKLWYTVFLELDHGSFMRNAADAKYKLLAGNIKRFFDNP